MGVIYDYASSILLCPEDNSSILGFDDDDELGINDRSIESGIDMINEQKSIFCKDSSMVFPLQSEESLFLMMEKESEHLPARDYAKKLMNGTLDVSIRKDAVEWIWKVHAYYSFGPLCAYLSVNYLDRFLSAYELPQGKEWMTQLLAVACLSLASKMEETVVPLSLDLQVGNAKYVFEAKTIQRMELLVLNTLKWRMLSITPFSFMEFFLNKFSNKNSLEEFKMERCVDIILSTIRGIGILEFKPSEVAAAAALTALGVDDIVEIQQALSCCNHVKKEKVIKCYDAIQDIRVFEGNPPSVPSVPQSPIGVLDAKCLSYKSDETLASSHESSQNNSPSAKKRKLNSCSEP